MDYAVLVHVPHGLADLGEVRPYVTFSEPPSSLFDPGNVSLEIPPPAPLEQYAQAVPVEEAVRVLHDVRVREVPEEADFFEALCED